jgi:hypothetical protein
MSSTSLTAPLEPSARYEPPRALTGLQRAGLVAALLGFAACAAGAAQGLEAFFRAYLVGWLLVLQIALGSLGLLMLHHLTHGAWGIVLRRPFEAAAATLPALAVLFVPVLLGMRHLYPWSDPAVVAADPILQQKAAWLGVTPFTLRAAFYFAVWIALGALARRWSLAQDRTGGGEIFRKLRVLSALGLVLFVLTVSFAAIDWVMTLDPHWFSSIYGVQFIGGSVVAALCAGILASRWLAAREPMVRVFTPKHHHDHGTLLFAFLLLWGYFGVSQFLIIWSANLPEEVPFYLHRGHGAWRMLSAAIVLLHWAVPFFLLLSPRIKRVPGRLAAVATLVLVLRWVDLYWQVAPNFRPAGPAPHWLDAAVLVGVGGVCLALYARHLAGRSLLPLHDPFLPEALAHE